MCLSPDCRRLVNLIPLCAPGYMLGLSTLEAVQWVSTSLPCLQGQSFDPTGAGGTSLFAGWRCSRSWCPVTFFLCSPGTPESSFLRSDGSSMLSLFCRKLAVGSSRPFLPCATFFRVVLRPPPLPRLGLSFAASELLAPPATFLLALPCRYPV